MCKVIETEQEIYSETESQVFLQEIIATCISVSSCSVIRSVLVFKCVRWHYAIPTSPLSNDFATHSQIVWLHLFVKLAVFSFSFSFSSQGYQSFMSHGHKTLTMAPRSIPFAILKQPETYNPPHKSRHQPAGVCYYGTLSWACGCSKARLFVSWRTAPSSGHIIRHSAMSEYVSDPFVMWDVVYVSVTDIKGGLEDKTWRLSSLTAVEFWRFQSELGC